MLIIHISGDVIGVGFRAATYRFAKELNLTGYVRNMSDQTVEIGLDSTEKDANALINKLKTSGFTRIDDIEIKKTPDSTHASGFEIRY